MSFLELFSNPSNFFKKLPKQNGQAFIIYFIALAISSILFYYKTASFVSGIQFLAVGLLGIFFASFVMHILLKIYGAKEGYFSTLKILVYTLIPAYVVVIISILSDSFFDFILYQKPIILLLFAIYEVYLFVTGTNQVHSMSKGKVFLATALFVLFVYIFSLRIWQTVIFYSLIMAFLYYEREKFDRKTINLLYRTKIGLGLMEKSAKKFPRTIRVIGIIGVVVGYVGMVGICALLIKNLYDLLFVVDAIPGAAPILPGIPIPGSPIILPLWYGIFSLFVVILVHEFAHGVLSRVYGVKVKSSGLFFLGPLAGAFVEPDEKQLSKKPTRQQLSVFAAGPFANIILAGIVLLILNFLVAPVVMATIDYDGVLVVDTHEAYPAREIGLESNIIIQTVNGIETKTVENFTKAMEGVAVGQTIILKTNSTDYSITTAADPKNASKSYIGVFVSQNIKIKDAVTAKYGERLPNLVFYFQKFFVWLFIITLGIGVINLVPLGPVDGGRILQVTLYKFFKKERADMIWRKVGMIFLFILAMIILFPLFRWILPQLKF
ncbi:site-2 protease family protein [Candidatus Woesearchaeota archaeon]|nr:site-2 protease family protein [Candidatus Woesearchaeota archaeon]